MEKSNQLASANCLNCGAEVQETFCHRCGQRIRENLDRSLSRLLGEFFSNLFFFDNRFFLSIRYLFGYPGRMTAEFLEGKRKKFVSPVTLFLFINLIYFFASPLSDYSLAYIDQIYYQPYSGLIQGWAESTLQEKGITAETYAVTYQNRSDTISKSIMIINVPLIALLVYLVAFKRRRFYFDSLIFSFHFFSLFLSCLVVFGWIVSLIDFLPDQYYTIVSHGSFYVLAYILPVLYAILSIKRFLQIRWYWAIPAGLGALVGVPLANLVYRFIIFIVTFSVT